MNQFEFYSAGRIIFGAGSFKQIGDIASEFGKKALIVATQRSLKSSGVLSRLEKMLTAHHISFLYFSEIISEPTVEVVDFGADLARKEQVDFVIGLGGGSCIDAGKAISGLATNNGSVLDYLEGVGTGAQITKPALPYLAIPTTAGTGAEVTKNAVIASKTQKFKKSIRSPHLIPNIALVDPELTQTLPPKPTAYSGMDALTQCIEAFVSRKAQPIASALALEGISHGTKGLLKAFQNGNDLVARHEMALCSLLSGLALANSGLGATHGIGAALGALFGIPHGLACAITLPAVMAFNLPAQIEKYAVVGITLTGQKFPSHEAAAEAAVDYIGELSRQIGIPQKLREIEIQPDDIPLIVKNSGGSSMKGNPREMSESEIIKLLQEIY